ncbi:hypothetical protein [Paenibacillus xerothermodurans]|uniref:Uncharacterized protein n=1 Tax=Paenibacillus xerothermodurans TaxID=1977292 RepID=A0A2W1NYS8_PAEXE|nr:hypothetical protein [Paenibacillus xerothermodurans]PZE20692.1 hypothetical protein CBW46_010970 [Paenibacillus xerothermodurans]
MNIHVVSGDRRLLTALRSSGEYSSVAPVMPEMAAELLMDHAVPALAQTHVEETSGGGKEARVHVPEAASHFVGRAAAANMSTGVAHEFKAPSVLPGDVWLVSDMMMDINEATALHARFPDHKLIYMLSNSRDPASLKAKQTLCAAHGIDFVLPYFTPEQTALEVSRLCLSKERINSKVMTAIGALPQMGLTSSLIGVGLTLAKLSGRRVGILGLNGWNPGDTGLRYSAKYMDELWGALQGKQLQAEELRGKMQTLAPNVHYLAGNRDLKKLYYYNTDGVSWLIEKAREAFDFVLLDAGSYPDHAMAAQSIHAADFLVVQMNQSLQAKTQWQRMREHILQPVFRWSERQSMLLFNTMHRSADMENEKQLSRQLAMPYLGSLPYVSAFYRSETEGSLASRVWPEYDNELQKVGRAIMRYYNLQPSPVAPHTQNSSARISRGSWLRWMKPAGEA